MGVAPTFGGRCRAFAAGSGIAFHRRGNCGASGFLGDAAVYARRSGPEELTRVHPSLPPPARGAALEAVVPILSREQETKSLVWTGQLPPPNLSSSSWKQNQSLNSQILKKDFSSHPGWVTLAESPL